MLSALLTLTLSGAPMSLYDISVETIDGRPQKLADFKGKALLIVNTASECGYTPQYKGLEALYQRYQARGFTVLAFPSNDFGGQEPGTNAEVKKFCELKYKTTFPLFAKVKVKGPDAHPLFAYLQGLPKHGGEVKWNFNKFLVDPLGNVVAHLPSGADPGGDEVAKQVEAVLPATK